jgi:hypothetical protein
VILKSDASKRAARRIWPIEPLACGCIVMDMKSRRLEGDSAYPDKCDILQRRRHVVLIELDD